jgi:hypothetical protein
MKPFKQLLRESEFIDIHSVNLKSLYRKFNAEYFNNELPDITIEIRSIAAGAEVRATQNKLSKKFTLQSLVMSSKYKYTENRLRNVFCHEMLHVFLMYNQIQDTNMHGIFFQRKMREINAQGGVTIGLNDDGAVSNVENKKGIYIFLTHQKGTDKFLMSVLQDTQKDVLSEYLFGWYYYPDDDGEHKWEQYYLQSFDHELMIYPKARTTKTIRKFIIKEPFYDSLIENSTIIRQVK